MGLKDSQEVGEKSPVTHPLMFTPLLVVIGNPFWHDENRSLFDDGSRSSPYFSPGLRSSL